MSFALIFLGASLLSDSQGSVITPQAATRVDRPSDHQSCRDRTAGENVGISVVNNEPCRVVSHANILVVKDDPTRRGVL
ncbi:MAG: hypothetical protein CL447_04615 [Acidimicrobiaceae bacterium]|nr:hypothetical protein [Acidimicrobiaceae bacterium]HBU75186.1 hypothetical protein [Acidimicrobiaceae bacterium]